MTTTDDLDRVLAQWLEEGQAGAPDWPIERAIDHARSHPRRRDPFAFLRSDVMPAGRSRITLQPVGILAVLGLVVALVAAVAVGGGLRREAVLPPAPDVAESPTPSPTVTPPPSPAPADEPDFDVAVEAGGGTNQLLIFDASDRLTDATSGTPDEGASAAPGEVSLTNDDASTIRMKWSAGCEDRFALSLDAAGVDWTLEHPICAGDAVATDRVVVLTFADAVDASSIEVEVTPGPGDRLPQFRQFTSDGAGDVVWVDVNDESGTLTGVDQASSEAAPVERDVLLVEAADGDPRTLVLTWSGPACETEYEVLVHGSGRQIDLGRQACEPSGSLTNRAIALTFGEPVDPATIVTGIGDLTPK